jgi:hypothetical protein
MTGCAEPLSTAEEEPALGSRRMIAAPSCGRAPHSGQYLNLIFMARFPVKGSHQARDTVRRNTAVRWRSPAPPSGLCREIRNSWGPAARAVTLASGTDSRVAGVGKDDDRCSVGVAACISAAVL